MTIQNRSTDLGAALTGLIVGATVIFAILFAIVKLTTASYAHEEGAPKAAESGAP